MYLCKKILLFGILPALIFFTSDLAKGQTSKQFKYISPVPGSNLNPPESNIIIRMGDDFDASALSDASLFNVTGSKSGKHSGKVVLTEDNKTVLFYPDKRFANGETVTVELKGGSRNITPFSYSFETSKTDMNKIVRSESGKYFRHFVSEAPKNFSVGKTSLQKTNDFHREYLPEDFPQFTVDSINNPAPGYISFSPFNFGLFTPNAVPISYYLIITDNYGVPVFYRKIPWGALDFKKQRTGVLSYYDVATEQYYLLDSLYNLTDSLSMQNGYPTDLHELEILDNGHALMMAYDYQQYPMDTVIFNGDSNAVVTGLVIQELDENKNVIFQWRSWDHFKVTDATYNINLTDTLIDYVHGNAIEMDYDGNILISSRHMDEVTKIDRQTGNIIWRLGGKFCRNNQFAFQNDPIGFSHQHDIRRLPNGNIILFDNGNLHDPQFSRVVEYEIDEVNKTATLVWEYRNDPETFNGFMGSGRRLENQNTFIGWGGNLAPPSISEVQPDGTVSFYLTLPDTLINYRAFKFPWKTSLFSADTDTLSFGFVSRGDSLSLSLTITNNSDSDIEINGIYNRDSAFTAEVTLPIVIAPGANESVIMKFKPVAEGDYLDDLYLRWDKSDEGVALVVPMTGSTDSILADVNGGLADINYTLNQNYPNPFNPSTKIKFSIPQGGLVKLVIYNILGGEVKTLLNNQMDRGVHEIEFNGADLPSGVYLYKLTAGDFTSTKKLILMK
ncbi:MAG: aryl-sulfate sulfotransferase [Ignavibacteriaceae bacterium]